MELNTTTDTPTDKSPLTQVTPVSKYLALALFILLPFLGGWVGYTYAPEKIIEIEKIVTLSVEKEIPTETQNKTQTSVPLTRYENREIGIAFSYPSAWGDIVVKVGKGDCPMGYSVDPCEQKILSFLKLSDGAGIVLATETAGHEKYPFGRGAFWGDSAGAIKSDYLEKCTAEATCKVLSNQFGVMFAKYVYQNTYEGESGLPSYMYHLYRIDSNYFGTILSPTRIKSISPDIEKLFEDTVVNSFELLPPAE